VAGFAQLPPKLAIDLSFAGFFTDKLQIDPRTRFAQDAPT
jgi:hypothetical protein